MSAPAKRPVEHRLYISARRWKLLPWPRKKIGVSKVCSCQDAHEVAEDLRARRARVVVTCRGKLCTTANRPPSTSRWRSRAGDAAVHRVMSKSEAKRIAYPSRARSASKRKHGRA